MQLREGTLENAAAWFESLGYSVTLNEAYDTMYLELDGFSVELSQSEIVCRANQWVQHLKRED
jgi:hypothetical protein